MTKPRYSLHDINAFDREQFVSTLGFLFESSPWVAERAYDARPFASENDLHQALCLVMFAADGDHQLALIKAHPDLAGKAAIAGDLTPESTREQASAGLDRLSPAEFARFTQLNSAYRTTFGFPFIICVREHSRHSILSNFEMRLQHSRDQEIGTALDEIAKIARLRLLDVMATDPL